MFTVKGTVKDFQFLNPHVEISLDVKNEDGTVESWQAEMNSPAILSRASGWNKNTLKSGDVVVMEGHRSKHGLKVIRVEKVSLPDGTEIFPKGGNGVTRF
jgi:DNA/RNA endonuclease YhcR with UshA esterase domain